MSEATGVARGSILAGMKELELPQAGTPEGPRRVRRSGAGRKKLVDQDQGLRDALERLETGTMPSRHTQNKVHLIY